MIFTTSLKNTVAVALAAALSFALTGCQGLQTRGETEATRPDSITRPRPNSTNTQTTTSTPSTPVAPMPVPVQTGNVPSAPVAPTFLSKELPKVGIILGAGGMKAFAQLGVLREFQRARIPIHAVVGLEWGSVIGGLYASQGQINEAEWKSFKLRADELPSHGFMSAKIKSAPISSIHEFLNDTFNSLNMDRAKIPFACVSYTARNDRLAILEHGGMRDAMNRCVPYPPLFTDTGGTFAEPFAVTESANWLRAHGANVIVLVNVLAQGEIFQANLVPEQSSENLLWNEIRRNMESVKSPVVNWVVNVNTSGHPITDADGRRAIMDSGAKAATDVVNKMASQYGF